MSLFISLSFLLPEFALSQSNNGAIPGCTDELKEINNPGPFYVRIYIHVIRRNDGSGGQTQEAIDEMLSILEEDFSPHSIFFIWDCEIDDVKNTTLYNSLTNPGQTESIYSINPHLDGIDLYLFPDNPITGDPSLIGEARFSNPSAFIIGGTNPNEPYNSMVQSHAVSHEMGHSLGLLHTHHNIGQFTTTGEELVDQDANPGNCEIAGDCICDTPADPDLRLVNVYDGNECIYVGTEDDSQYNLYDPLMDNIMSYVNV